MLRRITIDSIGPAVAVTPFAGSVNRMGLTAKVAPEPPSVRPFQAGQKGATGWPLNRALYGRNKGMCGTKRMDVNELDKGSARNLNSRPIQ